MLPEAVIYPLSFCKSNVLKHELVMLPVHKKLAACCKLLGSLQSQVDYVFGMFSASLSTFPIVL